VRTIVVFAAAALSCSLLAAPARAATPVLVAKSGFHGSFTITLTFPDGRRVRTLRAGMYKIVAHDYSKIHNFALGSQTQNRRLFTTGIRWVGTRTYTLKLVPGSYAYACSAHFQTMNGRFVVR
jgi:plastocyanin